MCALSSVQAVDEQDGARSRLLIHRGAR